MRNIRSVLTFLLFLLAIPGIVLLGGLFFREKYFAWIAHCVAILSCLPLFYSFARKESSAKELTVLAAMIALSVAGRFLFAWLPGFKPVTAITVLAAIWLGKEAGFTIGALSAVISNFYFGQGPWTPFQMFAWGFLGFLAGLLAKPLQKSRILLLIFGAFGGFFYSATLDIWTTVWAENGFNLMRYLATFFSSLPVTLEYSVSNVLFLLLLHKPMREKLERVKKKYGLFLPKQSTLSNE